jgi:4-amino-4-deoxy-L-arabinose transferase-like glycosyltransferase
MVFLIGFNEATITCPYTDITLMPFVSIAFWLMTELYYSNSSRERVELSILLAITFALGYLIKPHMIAVIAAGAIVFIIPKLRKRTFILAIAGIFIFGGIVGGYNMTMRLYVKELEHPPHWLYMYAQSLEYDLDLDLHLGIYDYGNNNTTIEEKQQFLNNYIRERMRELGPVGYIKLLFNKTFLLLGDGIKSQTCNRRGIEYQSNFFSRIYYESVVGNVLRYVLWVTLMFGVVLNLFDKKRSPFHSLVKLFPLVIFTLLLFTETSSRYLIGFLPLLCIGSVLGYAHCLTRLKKCDTINHG